MLDPETEQWAVAIVNGVGEIRLREMDLDGARSAYQTFDVDLDVIDGWNVRTGPIRAFWWEGSASRRFVIGRMIGQRVLVRFAPVRDGRHLLVGTRIEPAFEARAGEPFVSIILPYGGARLETGPPALRAWKTLWRAGLALDPIAYPDFSRYMDIQMPITVHIERRERRDKNGRFLGDETPGLADTDWLFRLAREGRPEYRMLIADYLRNRAIEGALKMKRDLVLLALQEPDNFPNGFLKFSGLPDLFQGYNYEWLPVPKVVDALLASRSGALVSDLFELLTYPDYFVANRAKLLPLMTSTDALVRDGAVSAFERWHGKPPVGTDPLAWHAARAKLGQAELKAAKAATAGSTSGG